MSFKLIIKYVVICFLVFLTTCGGSVIKNVSFDNVDKIVYRFGDSSVPPRFHRSYTIVVTKNKAKIEVDSYGDIVNNCEIEITENQFIEIIEKIKSAEISNCSKVKNPGCSGGTSESLKLDIGDKNIFQGRVYHCGGNDSGDMKGDIKSVASDLRNLFVNFQTLVD